MERNDRLPPTVPPQPSADDRLESWKEIAAYLKRDVRTLRRWEKSEGLPVHRHMHEKLPTVYAFRSELDAWLESRRTQPEPQARSSRMALWRRLGWTAVAIGLAALAAGSTGLWFRGPPPLPFDQRGWVLIARFENRTGEEVFDGTLEFALERELSNAPFVNVVPPERIQDALRLMRQPADTVIDGTVGREICLRDGGIHALITGRVEKLDSTYVLSATLVSPASGVAVASISEEAVGQPAVVPAIGRMARRVRAALGEEVGSIQQAAQALEKVSTPSLHALHLYSSGNALIQMRRGSQAVPVLQQAVREDPDFASAHVLLAHSLSNIGRHHEAAFHYQRALELADTVTDRERYFILASHHQRHLVDDLKAIEYLELLLRFYPDDYWGTTNLAAAYAFVGRPRSAVAATQRRADLRPRNFDHQVRAAQALAAWGDLGESEPYLRRARDLIADGQVDPGRIAWLSLFPAHAHWARGDLPAALQEVTRTVDEVASSDEEILPALRFHSASMFLALGRWHSAAQMIHGLPAPDEDLALLALALGDDALVRRHLRRIPASHRAAVLLSRTGEPLQAEQALADPRTAGRTSAPFLPGVWDALARGELALARGDAAEAIPLLEESLRILRAWPTSFFFLGTEALARAWQQQGNLSRSLEVLEQASPFRGGAAFWGPAPHFWMKLELQRAAIYRRLGREAEAQEVEVELRGLLALADPDHPILRELARTPGR